MTSPCRRPPDLQATLPSVLEDLSTWPPVPSTNCSCLLGDSRTRVDGLLASRPFTFSPPLALSPLKPSDQRQTRDLTFRCPDPSDPPFPARSGHRLLLTISGFWTTLDHLRTYEPRAYPHPILSQCHPHSDTWTPLRSPTCPGRARLWLDTPSSAVPLVTGFTELFPS